MAIEVWGKAMQAPSMMPPAKQDSSLYGRVVFCISPPSLSSVQWLSSLNPPGSQLENCWGKARHCEINPGPCEVKGKKLHFSGVGISPGEAKSSGSSHGHRSEMPQLGTYFSCSLEISPPISEQPASTSHLLHCQTPSCFLPRCTFCQGGAAQKHHQTTSFSSSTPYFALMPTKHLVRPLVH